MSVPKDEVFDRMRELVISGIMTMPPSEQLDLVSHCPKLETFEWDLVGPISARVLIDHLIQKDRGLQVDELRCNPRFPQDRKMASILEGIWSRFGKLADLSLWYGTLGPQALKALGFHFSMLVVLRLDCISVASSTVRDVLCSCPRLEIPTPKISQKVGRGRVNISESCG